MDETHEIKRLNIQIDGKVDHELKQAIYELIPDVIEDYFDKYDLKDRPVLIDKIQFDLGTIKASNFKEELLVRLSYLLNTELQKFFEQPNIRDQIEEKIIISNTQAFVNYLQKGYSKFEDKDLSQLFEHLLQTDIFLLREIIREVRQSPNALNRLFYQVKYEKLEEYWSKIYASEFQKVKRIENQILADFGQKSLNEYKEESISGFLKKLTFNFMMDKFEEEVGTAYLERLKDHVDELKAFEHLLNKSAYKYLDDLSKKILKGSVFNIERQVDKPDNLEIILGYIISGKEEVNLSKSSVVIKSRELAEKDLKILLARLDVANNIRKQQFERLQSIFSIRQFEIILRILMQSGNSNLSARIAEINYFRTIVKELFNEDIYAFYMSDLSKYLISTSSSNKNLTQLIAGLIELISAKNRITKVEIIKNLGKRIDGSVHKYAKVFSKHVKQLQSELGASEEYHKRVSTDPMTAYLHFLKTGIWILEKITPQEVLIKLLEEHPEHLAMELTRHLGIQTVWLRLVYQHQIDAIKAVFETVFKGDKDLNLLLDRLESIESVELKELLQRKLLEAFVTAKVLMKSNAELSFEIIFEKSLADLSLETKILQASDKSNLATNLDQILSTHLFNNKRKVKLDRNQRKFVVDSISSHPHLLTNYLSDQNISNANWERFFIAFDRNEMLQLLKVMVIIQYDQNRWIPAIINSLDNKELTKFLNKSRLIVMAVLLIKGDESAVEIFMIELFDEVKEKHEALAEKLTVILPMLDLKEANSYSHELLIKGAKLSSKELVKAATDLVDILSALKGVLEPISTIQLNNLLLDILPFVKTTKELEEKFVAKLISDYPQYYEALKSVKSLSPYVNSYSSLNDIKSFDFLINELIESGSVNVQPYFENFESFEKYFFQALQRPEYLKSILSKAAPHRLVKFLIRLTTATFELLNELILHQFAQTRFLEIKLQLIDTNDKLKQEINYFSIAYGLIHSRFNQTIYLKFIDDNIESIQLQEGSILIKMDETAIEVLPELYVEAFIHYLKFKKHIYIPVEHDGLQVGLSKIVTYWQEELLVQLRESTAIQQVVENLLLVVPESRQIGVFTQLFPYQKGQVIYAFEKISETLKVSKARFLSTWAELNLTSRLIFSFSQTIEHLLTILKPTDKSLTPLKLTVINKEDTLTERLSSTLINSTIHLTDYKHFTVSDLVNQIIETGRIPLWLKEQTRQEFERLFKEIAKNAPDTVSKIFSEKLKIVKATSNVQKIIGVNSFHDIIKIVESKFFSEIKQLVKKLAKIHHSLGQSEALLDYFFIRYLTVFYLTGRAHSKVIIANVLSKVALDFGLSSTDYKELLQESNEKIIKEFLSTFIGPKPEVIEIDTVYQIDFLLHLVNKNQIPWWAASSSFIKPPIPIEKQIAQLVITLFEKDPKPLINSILGRVDSDQIYQRLLPNITNQQFDRILIIVAPDFGGFMVSFNLLIIRSKIKIDRARWFSFLLRIASETKSFKATIFVAQALSISSEFVNENIERLRIRLLDIAKTAIKNGEMRFLPFVDLLSTTNMKGKLLTTIPDISIKIDSIGFVETVVYYVRTGSIHQSSISQIKSYSEFTNLIERQIQFGHNELRLSISKVITDEKVRSRLIKNEKENFLNLLVRVLYPTESSNILTHKIRIIQFLKQKWTDISPKVLDEIFYRSIFEQELDNHTKSQKATDLDVVFIQRASQLLNREVRFSTYELKDLELDGKLSAESTDPQASKVKEKQDKVPSIELPILEEVEDSLVDHRVLVKNAGLVITWPYLTRFFELLDMTKGGKFKSEADAVRAVHLLQYIASGTTKAPEHELLLNKVLCGLRIATPIPLEADLTDKEIETCQMMIKGLLQNWEKLKSSSIEALREGFLVRDGYILEKEKTWELKVEKKTLDILMGNMPWAFGTIKLPWMEKRLNVEWL